METVAYSVLYYGTVQAQKASDIYRNNSTVTSELRDVRDSFESELSHRHNLAQAVAAGSDLPYVQTLLNVMRTLDGGSKSLDKELLRTHARVIVQKFSGHTH